MRTTVLSLSALPTAALIAAAALALSACGGKTEMVAADPHAELPAGAVDAVKAEGGEAFGLPPTNAARKSAPMPSSL